jgi:hypothetical protein
MMAVEDIASALPITAADAGLWPSQEAMIASAAADTTTCNAPRPNTSLRIPMRRFHDNSSAIMNKRNATPNSAMGAICPTSVMETAESQDTSLARAPRPNGPRTMPAARNPKTGLTFSRPKSGTITPAVARNSSSSL